MLVILRAFACSIANRTEVRPSEDSSVGALSINGTWNGLIRMLVDQEVDVAVADVTMTSRRVMVVDVSVPLFISRYVHYGNWIILYFVFCLWVT